MTGGRFEPPAHPQVDPVEIGQQQVALAELGLQLQRHQQFAPLAGQGVPLTHLLRVKAARQLLGQGAAPLEYPPPQQIAQHSPCGADRVHPGVAPEAAVLTGQQRVDQNARVGLQAGLIQLLVGIRGGHPPVQRVVEQQRSPLAAELAADGNLQAPQGQHHQPRSRNGRQQAAAQAAPVTPAGRGRRAELERWLRRGVTGAELQVIAIGENELLHPPAAPPEAVGGLLIRDQPLAAAVLQQGVVFAHPGRGDADLRVGITADAVRAWMQHQPLRLPIGAAPVQLSGSDAHGHATDRWPGRAPRG